MSLKLNFDLHIAIVTENINYTKAINNKGSHSTYLSLIKTKMAKYFSQTDIDLFKECFFFITKHGFTQSASELGKIMRSLSYSPSEVEVEEYFNKHVKDRKIDFASFLEVMHEHNQKESSINEIMAGFKAHDNEKKGYIQASEVRSILLNLGERLTPREVEALFRDGGVSGGQIRYQEFINNITQPVPDY